MVSRSEDTADSSTISKRLCYQPSLASLKNKGNGTKDQSVPQTTMKDPTTPAPETTAATPKKDEPTLDQLVEQKITLLPNMDTGQLISLKTEVDTQVETYQDAITELNTELGLIDSSKRQPREI